MTDKETISKWLQEAFDFSCNGFSSPIRWTDAVGISRVKELPHDHASLYKIGINDEELGKNSERKRLSISVSYGKKVLEGISIGSEGGLSSPVDFDNRDEFLVDINSKTFFQKERKIEAETLLGILEERHMRPTKLGRGFLLRSYLWFWRALLPGLVKFVDLLLLGLLWIISGETLKKDSIGSRDLIGRLVNDWGTEKTKEGIKDKFEFTVATSIDFFGYPAKRWSVVFYCVAHLILFILFSLFSIHSPLLESIFKNNFSSLCYVVVSFAITEAGIPWLLKFLIGNTPRLYGHIAFMRINFWG